MATDPLWIAASAGAPAYTANELRAAMALLTMYGGRVVGGRAGVRPGGTGLDTQLAGSTITVKAGCALVDPALTTTQGPYWVALTSDETHTLTAAHGTFARKDITVLRVYDHDEDSSGLRKAQSEYIVGTAASSPSEPSVPSGAFKIATIDVPQSGGGSPVVTINYPYTVASGGIIPFRTTTERDSASSYDGMFGYVRATDQLYAHDGTAWRPYPDPPLAQLTQITSQSIPSLSFTAVSFNAEDHDTHNGHDTVTNNSRYTSQRSGYYQLSGAVAMSPASTLGAVRWTKNGTVIAGSEISYPSLSTAGAAYIMAARTIQASLNTGDYVELKIYQESGAALSTNATSDIKSTMSVTYLRPLS